jgi:CheY-like chemotaxis protein
MTCVIVVDDDPRLRTMTRILLEEAGHEVVEVADGAAAIGTLRDRGADLVLCDLFMPGFDGLEVIRTLRREFPGVKVIAMSGGGFGGTMDLLAVARHLGAAEILHKPFTQKTVLEAIERTLRPRLGDGQQPVGPGSHRHSGLA